MFAKQSEIHCIFCERPKNIWKPLKTYQSDDSCEFYNDVFNTSWGLENTKGFITYQDLLKACAKMRDYYDEIPNFDAAVRECFDIFEDTRTFNS